MANILSAQVRALVALSCIAVIAGCSVLGRQSKPAATPEIRPGILSGYLEAQDLPNSLQLLPPPPAEGSAPQALDERVSRKSLPLRGTAR